MRLSEHNERLPLISVAWADVKPGDTVYTDSYQDGKFPNANPRICGPFTVKHTKNRVLETVGHRFNVPFIHYPETLLRSVTDQDTQN